MSASDDTKNASFLRSRMPVEYRDRAFGLSALGEHGRAVLDWVELDGLKKFSSRGVVLEVVGKSSLSRDVFYAIARAFILKSISVRCVHSIDLLKENMTDELKDDLEDRGVLVIDRMGCDSLRVINAEKAFEIEVFLEKWVSTGRSILFRAENEILKNEQWTQSFRHFLKNRLKRSFIVG
jgi:hypothetical protein